MLTTSVFVSRVYSSYKYTTVDKEGSKLTGLMRHAFMLFFLHHEPVHGLLTK